jgi:oxygen-independent coproporphyrinogen-3 oxidase
MERETGEALGIYVSIPFCRAKCSFCNFASGVFAAEQIAPYLDRVLCELREARKWSEKLGTPLPQRVDTVYLGGGTPSLLSPASIARLFAGLRSEFVLEPDAEITVECAPLQLSDATLAAYQRDGVNRLSFGVQSFVDRECSAVGRAHTGEACLGELARVRAAGIARVGVDLIAGLPHQTEASWRLSLDRAIASGIEHVSVYMLEVDEDSRLGREVLAGGARFGAAALPGEDATADWHQVACETLDAAGLRQYEISNFARAGGQSKHNRRYWERRPYLGLGLDAHSMMRVGTTREARGRQKLRSGDDAVRWANAPAMEAYLHGLASPVGAAGWIRKVDHVDLSAGFEEALFLGLRLVDGVDVERIAPEFGQELVDEVRPAIEDLVGDGFLQWVERRLCLTRRGQELSNEVFSRLLLDAAVVA